MFSTASIPGVASSSLPDYNFPSLDEYDELLADILGEFDLGIPGISGGNSSGDDPFPNYEDIIEGILKEPSSQVSLRNVFFGRWGVLWRLIDAFGSEGMNFLSIPNVILELRHGNFSN